MPLSPNQGSGAVAISAPPLLNFADAPDPFDRSERRFVPLDYAAVNRTALAVLPAILQRWLPGGRREGGEWVARNPRRQDRRPGSFKVSLRTGRWSDFAADAKGGDPVSLAAYLFDLAQAEAARRLAEMLGVR